MASSQQQDQPNDNTGLGLFALLPAELRTEVWRMVLITNIPIKITHKRNERPGRKWNDQYTLFSSLATQRATNKNSTNSFPCVALLRASKPLNTETSPVLYHHAAFHLSSTAVLDTFIDQLGEMAFSLTTIVLTAPIPSADDAAPLALLRRMHSPKKIVLPVPIARPRATSQWAAGSVARETWRHLKPVIVRRGVGYILCSSMRGYGYDGVDVEGSSRRGRGLEWEYEAGSEEKQRARLEAFEFVVDERVTFERARKGVVDYLPLADAEERARRLKELVVERWDTEAEMAREA